MQKKQIMSKVLRGCFRKLLIPITLILVLSCSYASAQTLYVATTGIDSGACTNQSSPCRTISYGISQMSGGDTLIIGDGTYTEGIKGVPAGSSGNYTTVQAENTGGVILSGWAGSYGIYATNSNNYTIYRGFKVNAGGAGIPVFNNGAAYTKYFQIAAYGATDNGNVSVFIVGSGSSNVLVEECWAWGTGRYKFLVYQASNVVMRRLVSRHDYHSGLWAEQCAPFVMYETNQVHWQNCIGIDSGDSENTYGKLYGGIWCENNGAVDVSGSVSGSIFLNLHASGINDHKLYGTKTVTDTVIWDCNGGPWWEDIGTESEIQTVTVNRLTSGNTKVAYGGGGSVGYGARLSEPNIETRTLKNSIFLDTTSYGIGEYFTNDYNVFWGNGSNFNSHQSEGANDYCSQNGNAFDPETNGLLYLPRIEGGSTLKTAGESGGQIGAQIMYKIGTSGTLYGETGWNTTTSAKLWPFPNEDKIRTDMGSYSGPGPSGVRGFCSNGQTLTKYIWEYLGNPCPSDICSDQSNTILTPKSPKNLSIVDQ